MAFRPSNLTVSPASHLHCGARLTSAPFNVMLALAPAALFGMSRYGAGAVAVVGAAVLSAVIAEALIQMICRKPVTVADGSAAASGLLLAMILPAGTPLYIVAVASFSGIIVAKQFFGGLGANPLNPALVGWAVIRITAPWAGHLDFDLALANYDLGFPIEYPLAVLGAHGASALDFSVADLLFGRQTGGIGASAVIWVLLGGLYLIARGFVRWELPVSLLAGVGVTALIFSAGDAEAAGPIFHILTGNAMIAAFFFCTDYATVPTNRWGMIVYGLGAGALAIILRSWSNYADGMVFACLILSLFTPLLAKLRAKQVVPEARPLVAATGATEESA